MFSIFTLVFGHQQNNKEHTTYEMRSIVVVVEHENRCENYIPSHRFHLPGTTSTQLFGNSTHTAAGFNAFTFTHTTTHMCACCIRHNWRLSRCMLVLECMNHTINDDDDDDNDDAVWGTTNHNNTTSHLCILWMHNASHLTITHTHTHTYISIHICI